MKYDLFDDGIGSVEYISHMGSDLSVVNAARVSFGVEKREFKTRNRACFGGTNTQVDLKDFAALVAVFTDWVGV